MIRREKRLSSSAHGTRKRLGRMGGLGESKHQKSATQLGNPQAKNHSTERAAKAVLVGNERRRRDATRRAGQRIGEWKEMHGTSNISKKSIGGAKESAGFSPRRDVSENCSRKSSFIIDASDKRYMRVKRLSRSERRDEDGRACALNSRK